MTGEAGGFLWDDWRDADAVRAWLKGLDPQGGSGDLYARLA